MTDREQTPDTGRPKARRRRKPSSYPVVAGSLAAFMGLFGFMAYELRTGHDPALGKQVATAAVPGRKLVVLKRVEDRIIITKLIPPRGEDGGGGTAQAIAVPAASIPASNGSAPVVVQSAPVVVQRAAAPASAPAAAPVVTKTS